jgi:hypothetical protein
MGARLLSRVEPMLWVQGVTTAPFLIVFFTLVDLLCIGWWKIQVGQRWTLMKRVIIT